MARSKEKTISKIPKEIPLMLEFVKTNKIIP